MSRLTGPRSAAATSAPSPPAHARRGTRARPAGASSAARWRGAGLHLVLAVICYAPMLATKPGVVSDDTKTYLYLDPGRLLAGAANMWDPGVALGTVTHQNIGYLFPMGPFFWFFSAVHVPIWVAQRLWLGSILFAAAAGVLYLGRLFGLSDGARLVAATAYGLSPYVMQYAGRISVILLPFAGLPFLVGFMARACREKGWRYPAAFALVLTVVSGINASSVVYVVVAPLVYLPYAVFVERELTTRDALVVLVKTGLLSILTSLWWIAGLTIEGMFGVDILKYTESVEAASSAAAASEVIRGLGYWYFYNGDRLGLWTRSSIQYTTNILLIAVSYAVPIGAFAAATISRWRLRAYFVALVVVGMVLSVGPHPFASPTPLGALDKAFMTGTTAGEALRSTDRATPLVMLGLAMLLGAGLAAIGSRLVRLSRLLDLAALGVVLAASTPLLMGETVISQFSQPAAPPSYVRAAARYLDAHRPGTRVYSLPGNDFAAYTWGDTVDPVWPGLIRRPYVVHEQFIQGSMPTANLLYALDNPLQQGTMDFSALAPIARLMSVGDVLVEYDQQYARYDPPRPALLAHDLATRPAGLGPPVRFGAPEVNRPSLPMYDETYFDLPPGLPATRPLAVYPVSDPRPIVRADSLADPLVVAGDNVGIVSAADVGLLSGNPTILFSGTLDTHRLLAREVLSHPAQLVVTDTNRKQAFEWNSLAENTGYTETASERPTAFVANEPGFDLFPGAPTSAMTTSVLTGIRSVTASSYGTAFTLRSEERPSNAIDGNLKTAWETEGTVESPILGQWWQVTARHPVSADSVTLVQPLPRRNEAWLTNQWVTKVTLTFDGRHPVTVDLGPQSRTAAGEVVAFPRRRFTTMRVRIDATNFLTGPGPAPVGSSLVGFAEIRVGNLKSTQVVSMPGDLLARAGASSLRDRLTLVMTRERVAPVPPRASPEPAIVRQFRLPTARSFSLVGTARLSNLVPDQVIDRLVGRTNPVVVEASSSSRMPGNLGATASATLDGNGRTVWMPGMGRHAVVDSWLRYRFAHDLSVGHLTLRLASDAEHSRPTRMVVSAGGVRRVVPLPAIPVTRGAGSETTVHVSFPPVRGRVLQLTFTKVAVRDTLSYETSLETALPIGVAEVGIPGVPPDRLPASIPAVCRQNLLRVDGRPVPLEITGSTAAALAGDGLRVSLCGGERAIRLGPGLHLLQAAEGAVTGLNLDQLALDSAPGGAAMPEPGNGSLAPPAGTGSPGAPRVKVLSQSATSLHLEVSGARRPFLLVLGQSMNAGWSASTTGGTLGPHVLVDGFANGWLVRPAAAAAAGRPFSVDLTFAPQRAVDAALVVSAVAVLACAVILLVPLLRRRRRAPGGPLSDGSVLHEGALVASPVRRSSRIALGAVLAALGAFAIAGPLAGAVVAVVSLLAMALPRGRLILPAAATAVLVAGALTVAVGEHVDRYLPGGGWPSHFSVASSLVWIALGLLGADAGLEALRRRREGAPANPGGRRPPG